MGPGVPIGVPIRLMGVNTASGTEATFTSYANSGASTGGCSSNMNTNAASDPNPVTDTGTNATPHVALENNSDQIDQFANGDFPSPDYVDQAIEVATTLYIESNGVYNTNPYAAASTINGTSYTGHQAQHERCSRPQRLTCWRTPTRRHAPCSTSTTRTRCERRRVAS